MLHLVQSNRLDVLAEALLKRWDGPEAVGDAPPSQAIIVPGAAVERWLAHRIADRHGVCANVDFGLAASFIWKLFARVLKDVPTQSPFDRDYTSLCLFELLGKLPKDQAYAPLQRYVAGADDLKRLELARRIAEVFSQYMRYRPDWLESWDRGKRRTRLPTETEVWQAGLWKLLRDRIGRAPLRHPREEFFEVLAKQGSDGILPRRLRVFALPSIPPIYAQILLGLGRHIEVEWYHLNPCKQFWADIVTEKSLARRIARGDPGAALADVAHPLLASWGEQRRQQLVVLADALGDEGTQDHGFFVDAPSGTVLGRLQTSLLDLSAPAADGFVPAPGDHSLQVHVCHSLTRQLEVLHNQLLALFDADESLRASDIAVFIPELDGATPLINAVFGTVPPARLIPYSIVGQARSHDTSYLQAVEFLLQLPTSRFEAAAVFSFLEIAAVQERFGVDREELETIRGWLHAAGARWGRDAAHRQAEGVPGEWRHTWSESLHRLLVGYALPSGTTQLVGEVLPFGQLEGAQARTLGKLSLLVSSLARAAQALAQPRPLVQWPAEIRRQLAACLAATTEDADDDARLRDALATLESDAGKAVGSEAVSVELARELLDAQLVRAAHGASPTGRVTFCGVGPLRGLPFRVICLLGLDGGVFPRNPVRLEFDLMGDAPRAGDRKPREEDRGTFLDALSCAGEVFYVSYTGRSIRDNSELPPSVVVSELLDYLGRFHRDGLPGATGSFVSAHPLQPFDAKYFKAPAPAGYDSELLPAARGLQAPIQTRVALRGISGGAPLPPLPEAERRIELQELVWFFRNPARKYLARLGVQLADAQAEISADEPFALEEAWDLRDDLLELRLGGRPIQDCVQYAMARPDVPHGAWGRQLVESLAGEVGSFAVAVEAQLAVCRPPQPFELEIGGDRLWGSLSGLGPNGMFGYSLRKEGVHELLGWWLPHLVLCALRLEGTVPRTRVLQADGGFSFKAVADPMRILAGLIAAYREGQVTPLAFFPKTCLAYAEEKNPDHALKAWKGSRGYPGERARPHYRLILGGEPEAPPPEYMAWSGRLLDPLLEHREGFDAAGADPS